MNKKAIELSVNFLVIIIISLSLFIFGIKFLYDISSNSNDLSRITIDNIDDEIASLSCANTQQICISNSILNLKPKQTEIVSTRILSTLPSPRTFIVEITPGIFTNLAGEKVQNTDIDDIEVKMTRREFEIGPNDDKSFNTYFKLPSKSIAPGTYIFDMTISYEKGTVFEQYDKVQKIMIKVKK